MPLHKLILLAVAGKTAALSQFGEEVHCVGERAHLLRYDIDGEPNDGSSLKGVNKAVISMEASPRHADKCQSSSGDINPKGDKSFCYGANQDGTCTSAKADIPLDGGKLDCKDCFVGATADMFYNLNYSLTGLHSVEVGLRDMHVRGSVALHSHLSGSKEVLKGTKVLADNSTRFTLIDKLIGCPVCIKAKITVAAPTSVNYEMTLKDDADITAGAVLDVHLGDRAIKWDHVNGWTHLNTTRTVSVTPVLEISNVLAEADLTLSLDTSLQLDVDNLIWYHLNMRPTLPLKCTAKGSLWPIRKAQFCLNGDAEFTIEHEADLHWKFLTLKEYHHWGPKQDYDWAKSGIVHECKNVGPSSSEAATVVV